MRKLECHVLIKIGTKWRGYQKGAWAYISLRDFEDEHHSMHNYASNHLELFSSLSLTHCTVYYLLYGVIEVLFAQLKYRITRFKEVPPIQQQIYNPKPIFLIHKPSIIQWSCFQLLGHSFSPLAFYKFLQPHPSLIAREPILHAIGRRHQRHQTLPSRPTSYCST